MSEYLLKIMGLAIFSTVITNILPAKKTYTLIKNIFRLCLYVVIITPVATFIIDLTGKNGQNFSQIFPNYFSESVIQTDESYIKYCSEKIIENTERALSEKILKDYATEVWVEIVVKTTDTEEKIEKIRIAFIDTYNELIAEELKNSLESEFSISIEILKEIQE